MALFQRQRVNLTESGAPEVVDGLVTTHRYFSTLGVSFALGRSYRADEDRPEAPLRRRAQPSTVDAALRRRSHARRPHRAPRRQPTTVVGIAPAWLDGLDSPGRLAAGAVQRGQSAESAISAGTRRPAEADVQPDQAATQLAPLVQRAMSEIIQSENYRAFMRDGRYRPLVRPMLEDLIGNVREPLWILLGAVVVVLLVACGNVANLCLIRAEARQREMAVRVALGASRGRLVRKLLAEALVISAIGR